MAGKKLTKSQFIAEIAEKSGITKKQATAVLDTMHSVVAQQLGKKGPGEVIIPGLLKLNVVEKAAVPAHEGVNPFTKAPAMFKAKPASRAVKARAVKALKDAI
ncbi:MAG: HU family DNA-binding protein [Chloroflexi bacterium]|nr:HU family DNA-binding protein [Chloroflexota bacterium]MCL5273629.1 HU family DNA-binding protein [Chloroflexota bacterium]